MWWRCGESEAIRTEWQVGGSATGGDKAIAGEVGENVRVRRCRTSSGRAARLISLGASGRKNLERESHQVGRVTWREWIKTLRSKNTRHLRASEWVRASRRYSHVSAVRDVSRYNWITGGRFLDGRALSCRLFAWPVQTGQITVLQGRAFSLVGSADMLIKVDFAGKLGQAGRRTTPRQKP